MRPARTPAMKETEDIATVIDFYLDHLLQIKNFSPHTIESYGNDLAQWSDFLNMNNIPWKEVVNFHLYSFLESLNASVERKKSTWSRKSSSVRAFYRFAQRQNFLEKNPLKDVSSIRYSRPLPHPVNPQDMAALLEDDTGQKEFIQKRDVAVLETLYSSGMRISEALELSCGDILDGGQLEMIRPELTVLGKGKKSRVVFLGQYARNALVEYMKARIMIWPKIDLQEEPLFINNKGKKITRQGIHFILQQRKKLLQISPNISAHSLRHSFATDMMNEGADLRKVQEMLGHARLSTTQLYTRVAKDRIRNVYRETHPHAKKEETE